MGRPTKLTPELADLLCEARANGHGTRGAAAACGISRSTLQLWLSKGEEGEDPDPIYSDFSARFTRAGARAIGRLVNAVFEDAVGGVEIKRTVRPDGSEEVQVTPPNGAVALKALAQLDPEDWQPRKALEVSGPNAGPVEVAQADVVENVLARVRAAKERRAAEAARAEQAGQAGSGEEHGG
ncbi:hypothetical protein ACWCSD_34430 [Nonomuraea sp. NPDC001684]